MTEAYRSILINPRSAEARRKEEKAERGIYVSPAVKARVRDDASNRQMPDVEDQVEPGRPKPDADNHNHDADM